MHIPPYTFAFSSSGLHKLFSRFSSQRRCYGCGEAFEPPNHEQNCRLMGTASTTLQPIQHEYISSPKNISNQENFFFCPYCAPFLKRRDLGFCPLCGELTSDEHLPTALCGSCLQERPPWDSFIFYGEYSRLLRQLLLDLKFKGNLINAYVLGQLLAGHPAFHSFAWEKNKKESGWKRLCSPALPCFKAKKLFLAGTSVKQALIPIDVVIPIPLHSNRLYTRGFNQSHELARHLLAALSKKSLLRPHLLHRKRNTSPQRGLSKEERKDNIKNVFLAAQDVAHQHILLVDDVMTTGSTLRSATNTLLQAGAASVHVAVIARTNVLSPHQ